MLLLLGGGDLVMERRQQQSSASLGNQALAPMLFAPVAFGIALAKDLVASGMLWPNQHRTWRWSGGDT